MGPSAEDILQFHQQLMIVLLFYIMAQGDNSLVSLSYEDCSNFLYLCWLHGHYILIIVCYPYSTCFYCRLLGWWSIDEGSKEEEARLFQDGLTGYVSLY